MKLFRKSNNKGQIPGQGIVFLVLALLGVVFLFNWIIGFGAGDGAGLTIAPADADADGDGVADAVEGELTFTEDVTVTFSSWDLFAKGTNAGTGHLILELNGLIDTEVNDDSTKDGSPGNIYSVLLGNKTSALVAGTDYYPVLVEGTLPDSGTKTISAGQPKAGNAGSVVYAFFDENDDTNNPQALAANGEKTVRWKITANDNICIGNPTVGGMNAMTYLYNTTIFSIVKQLDVNLNDMTTIGTPTSVNTTNGKTTRTYLFPTVCDNKEITRKVRIESIADATTEHAINLTVSDISIDKDEDTLAIITGYEDEDSNDIGVDDFVVGSLIFS